MLCCSSTRRQSTSVCAVSSPEGLPAACFHACLLLLLLLLQTAASTAPLLPAGWRRACSQAHVWPRHSMATCCTATAAAPTMQQQQQLLPPSLLTAIPPTMHMRGGGFGGLNGACLEVSFNRCPREHHLLLLTLLGDWGRQCLPAYKSGCLRSHTPSCVTSTLVAPVVNCARCCHMFAGLPPGRTSAWTASQSRWVLTTGPAYLCVQLQIYICCTQAHPCTFSLHPHQPVADSVLAAPALHSSCNGRPLLLTLPRSVDSPVLLQPLPAGHCHQWRALPHRQCRRWRQGHCQDHQPAG